MKGFQQQLDDFKACGAQVFGINCESKFVQKAYADHIGVSFPMLSDANKETAQRYQVLLDELAGIRGVATRAVFVIDRDGVIRYVWMKGKEALPDVREVLDAARQLAR